jgi:hypothetical protein
MAEKGGKVEKVMGEFKRGGLHSGSEEGPKVTDPKQAIAIALEQAREAGEDVSPKKSARVPHARTQHLLDRFFRPRLRRSP